MKTFYSVFMAACILAACSKKDTTVDTGGNTNTGNTNTGTTAKGPWDGTYKMTSTQTVTLDTTSGTDNNIYYSDILLDTTNGSAFSGTLQITKDKMVLQGLGYNSVMSGKEYEYFSHTNKTTVRPRSNSSVVSGLNAESAYTISGADSVTINEAISIARIPWGSASTSTGTSAKLKFSYDGTNLTFNHYYSKKVFQGVFSRNYHYKVVTVYQKQ